MIRGRSIKIVISFLMLLCRSGLILRGERNIRGEKEGRKRGTTNTAKNIIVVVNLKLFCPIMLSRRINSSPRQAGLYQIPSQRLSRTMGDVGRGFRPIAPRTLPPGGGEGSQSPLGNSGGGPPEDGRMKRASTACKECQKRRTRVTTIFRSSHFLLPLPPSLCLSLPLS